MDGWVKRISPVVDPNSGTFKVTVGLEKGDTPIRPGMFVNVHIVTGTHENAILVPRDAIVYDGDYENDQAHSPAFRTHMSEMAGRALAMLPATERVNVVEVGAGQGIFLKGLTDKAGARLGSATGFDPAWRGAPGGGPLPVRLYADLFDAGTAKRLSVRPNLLVSRPFFA